jgi:PAS domain S-box-containing protein
VLHGLEENVAELQRTGRALRESEGKYRRLVDAAAEGVWVLSPDSQTLFVNERMAQILGCRREDMIGRPAAEFMLPEDATDHERHLATRREGKPEYYERRFRRSDGTLVWTSLSAAPILDDDGQYVGTFAMITDISERKRAEEEICRLNQDLERRVIERTAQYEAANKSLEAANKELEAFSYSVSHDLRAPLRAIDGFAHILADEYGDKLDETALRHLHVIRRNVGRMADLIDDLLAFSRMSRAEMTLIPVNMESLVREAFEDVRSAVPERNIELRLGPMPPARGDRAMIRQVLVNLLSNAVKFTASRPIAVIEVEGGTVEDGQNAYRVKDNGVGFDMRFADKLFAVFERLHGAGEFEGTGIGLAIVKRVINRHGGKVWGEGKVDEGACMHFTLPQA